MQFLRACLNPDPKQRATADELLAMPYFSGVTDVLPVDDLMAYPVRACAHFCYVFLEPGLRAEPYDSSLQSSGSNMCSCVFPSTGRRPARKAGKGGGARRRGRCSSSAAGVLAVDAQHQQARGAGAH